MPILLIAAFIALPSTAKAYSWWSGSWDSYGECTDYYTKNPAKKHTPEETCRYYKALEDEKLRNQQEINRVIVLSCAAESVTNSQFAACVALATGR
jgi:hypothetical protein